MKTMELCIGRVQTLNRIQTCRRTLSLGISKCKCDRVDRYTSACPIADNLSLKRCYRSESNQSSSNTVWASCRGTQPFCYWRPHYVYELRPPVS